MDETRNDKRKVVDDDKRDDDDPVVEITDGEFYWYNPDSEQANSKKSKTKSGSGRNGKNETEGRDVHLELEVEVEIENPTPNPMNNEVMLATKRTLPVLEGINVEILPGELVAIVGRVGAGKTSLLSSMLGETFQTKGQTNLRGSVAYSAQTAWIQNATLRENVLFGLPFDEERYWSVMQACQFKKDLEMLQDGDQTIIGERGINLSGGQKQRVSVARAAYSYAEILLLDDPMSALDPKVGKAVFEQCLIGLLADRTRVMATNQLNLLPEFDKIIVLAGGVEDESDSEKDSEREEEDAKADLVQAGHIVEAGTYAELMQSNGVLAKLMNKYTQKKDSTSAGKGQKKGSDEGDGDGDDSIDSAKNAEKGKNLMQVEERAKGAVKLGEYLAYFQAGGGLLIGLLIVGVTLCSEGAELGNTFVITLWTDDVNPDGSYKERSLDFYSLIYFATAGLVAFVALIRGGC